MRKISKTKALNARHRYSRYDYDYHAISLLRDATDCANTSNSVKFEASILKLQRSSTCYGLVHEIRIIAR